MLRETFLLLILICGIVCVNPCMSHGQEPPLTRFVEGMQSGEIDDLYQMMHPQLADQIDRPILDAWLQAVTYRLGQLLRNPEPTVIEADGRAEYSATVSFEKGVARVRLVITNDQITSFEVQSDQLKNWFQRPTNLKMYREETTRFLDSFQNRKFDDCLSQMGIDQNHQQLLSSLQEDRESVSKSIGIISDTKYRFTKLTVLEDERLKQMEVYYELQGASDSVAAVFVYRFRGMQGVMSSFSIRKIVAEK